MFQPYPKRGTAPPGVGKPVGIAHGTHDRKRWKGPWSPVGLFRDMFVGGARQVERDLYEMGHTGAVGWDGTNAVHKTKVGVSKMYTFEPMAPCPRTGRLIQARSFDVTTGLYEYVISDSDYTADLAAQISAATEHRRQTYQTYWLDDAILKLACSDEFFKACEANEDGGDKNMSAALKAACCTPNVMRHWPPGSDFHSMAQAKADYLLSTRPDGPSVGVIQTNGVRAGLPGTHKKEPRSAEAALQGLP